MFEVRGVAMLLLQGSDLSGRDVHWAMIFVGIIAGSLLLQALFVGITMLYTAKLLKRFESVADTVEKRVGPILDKTKVLVEELSPKVAAFTENAEQISYTVRTKVDELGVTVSELNRTVQEINGRTKVQVARADGMVTDALVATSEISRSVTESIKVPVRQVAGLMAGLKAGLETLIVRSPWGNRD